MVMATLKYELKYNENTYQTIFLGNRLLSWLQQICVKCNFRTLKLPFDIWKPVHNQMTVIRQ